MRKPDFLNKLIYTLRSYRDFEGNWCGYGGVAANNETINNAITFLNLLPEDTMPPYCGLSGDGEVELIWDKDCIFIDISLPNGSTYSFYARDAKGKEYFGDSLSSSQGIHPELINIMKLLKL
jgi:hypothetical protein